jgi:hypothetical protein
MAAAVISIAGARQDDSLKSVDVAGLRVLQPEGKLRAMLATSPDTGTYLSLMNARGIPRVGMAVAASDESAVFISDPGNKNRVAIRLTAGGVARIELQNAAGAGVGLVADKDGATFLRFHDKKGNPRIKLGLAPDGSPGLEFFDERGKSTSLAPVRVIDGTPR